LVSSAAVAGVIRSTTPRRAKTPPFGQQAGQLASATTRLLGQTMGRSGDCQVFWATESYSQSYAC
jgi:hypothetical protein